MVMWLFLIHQNNSSQKRNYQSDGFSYKTVFVSDSYHLISISRINFLTTKDAKKHQDHYDFSVSLKIFYLFITIYS